VRTAASRLNRRQFLTQTALTTTGAVMMTAMKATPALAKSGLGAQAPGYYRFNIGNFKCGPRFAAVGAGGVFKTELPANVYKHGSNQYHIDRHRRQARAF